MHNATFLLYRLIAQGNLVNVTRLFGMALIIIGLAFVFRKPAAG